MKATLFLPCLLFALLTVAISYGQDRPDDRRLTPQEQLDFEKSVPLNPAKVAEVKEEPRPGEPVVVPSPTVWKPVAQEPDDRPLPAVDMHKAASQPQPADKMVTGQPEAPKASTEPVSRRNMQGVKTQPDSQVKATPVNRRTLQGPRTQPEPKKTE